MLRVILYGSSWSSTRVSSQELSLVELVSYQDVYACLIEASRRISQLQWVDQCFLVIKLFIWQIDVLGNLPAGCVQLGGWCSTSDVRQDEWIVLCQSVCLDLICIETLWCVAVFTLLMPCMDACVWVRDNLKRCTHLSVMKCDCEALSNNARHGTYWPELFCTSTIAVVSKLWFLGLPLNEQ